MADTLLIHYNPAIPDSATWSLVNDAGELTAKISHGSLSNASELASNHKSVVLLNNTLVHINHVELPTQNRQKLLRAIPYALEEQIADDIENFHFVAGKANADNRTPVAGIHKEILKQILDTFAENKIQPEAIIPDALCLTANAQQWSVLLHEDAADIQFNAFNGSEYDRSMLPLIIKSALQNDTQNIPDKIILFCLENDTTDDIAAVLPESIELVRVHYNQYPLVVYCGQYKNAMPLNLLQGEFKPNKQSGALWQHWRLAAGLAFLWLVLDVSSTAVQYQRLKSENDAAQAEIIKIYKTTFPESKKIVNPRVQMEQKLSALKSGNSGQAGNMIELLSDSATTLAQDKSINLQSIDYRNSRMDLNLTSSNLSAIQKLNTSLNSSGKLKSEITSSTSDKNQVKGSLRLQKAGA